MYDDSATATVPDAPGLLPVAATEKMSGETETVPLTFGAVTVPDAETVKTSAATLTTPETLFVVARKSLKSGRRETINGVVRKTPIVLRSYPTRTLRRSRSSG
jgi:hypothetical protein